MSLITIGRHPERGRIKIITIRIDSSLRHCPLLSIDLSSMGTLSNASSSSYCACMGVRCIV